MPDKIITNESEDLKLKLSLEAALVVSLRSFFRQIAEDYKTVYSATGQVLNANVYNPELIGILRATYRKAGKKAGKELRSEPEIVLPDAADGEIDLRLIGFSEQSPVERARVINQATTNQLNLLTLGTVVAAAMVGRFIPREEVAKETAAKFKKRSIGRSANISVTETLNAVEGARIIEADGLMRANAKVKDGDKEKPLNGALFRQWWTREDGRVRPTHVAAHGQTVQGSQPFVVGNSLLMYPGDTSLGAAISEIAGCRCVAMTIIR